MEEKLQKYRNELPEGYTWSEDAKAYLLQRAYNQIQSDSHKEEFYKQQAEEQRKMEESRNKPRGFSLLYGWQMQKQSHHG